MCLLPIAGGGQGRPQTLFCEGFVTRAGLRGLASPWRVPGGDGVMGGRQRGEAWLVD
jgi:hypothetical protein